MVKLTKPNASESKCLSQNSGAAVVLSQSPAIAQRTLFEKITNNKFTRNHPIALKQKLVSPATVNSSPHNDPMRSKANQPPVSPKVLKPTDLRLIQNFWPKSQLEAIRAVPLARHALLNEDPSEKSYFIPDEVAKMLEKAHSLDPENLEIEFWRGLCARRQVRSPHEKETSRRARDHLNKVLMAYPNHCDVKAHYAAAFWVMVKANDLQEKYPHIMWAFKLLSEKDKSSLLLHTLATKRDSPLNLITSQGLRDVEQIAENHATDVPIQTFLLSAYYDCFDPCFVKLRAHFNKDYTFESLYKKSKFCLKNLKLLDPTSLIVSQFEIQLQNNEKEINPIYLHAPPHVSKVDAFFYDSTLWQQDSSLEIHKPFEQKPVNSSLEIRKPFEQKPVNLFMKKQRRVHFALVPKVSEET